MTDMLGGEGVSERGCVCVEGGVGGCRGFDDGVGVRLMWLCVLKVGGGRGVQGV